MLGGTRASARRWCAPLSSTSRRNKDDAVLRSTTRSSRVTAPIRDCPTGLRKAIRRIESETPRLECSFAVCELSTNGSGREESSPPRSQGKLEDAERLTTANVATSRSYEKPLTAKIANGAKE